MTAVHRRIHAITVQSDIGEFDDDVRRIFLELGRGYSSESLASECVPGVDVYETDEAMEIVVDLPGVTPDSVRLVAQGRSLLIAGEKPRRRARSEATFHLVERGYGRFARVVRLDRACDPARAHATVIGGELRISLPKIVDRRGARIPIAIT
jgi:HSP20 family protein